MEFFRVKIFQIPGNKFSFRDSGKLGQIPGVSRNSGRYGNPALGYLIKTILTLFKETRHSHDHGYRHSHHSDDSTGYEPVPLAVRRVQQQQSLTRQQVF